MKDFCQKLILLLLLFGHPLAAHKRRIRIQPRVETQVASLQSDSKVLAEDAAPNSRSLRRPKKPLARWTVMIYAQADPVLNNFAARNFQAMASIGSNKNLNIIVQWNQPRKKGTWRYKIDKNKMRLVDTSISKGRLDLSQDLIDFAEFSVTHYPAKNYALIFWGHGMGILDPEWSQLHNFSVNPASLRNTNTNETYDAAAIEALGADSSYDLSGLTPLEGSLPDFKTTATIPLLEQKNDVSMEENEQKRGLLYDISNRNYLNNQGFTRALSHITTKITRQKLGLVGMDCCLMSMLEVCYQMKDCADFSTASEEVELAYGWNYAALFHTLATTELTPKELAQSVVYTFEDFYKKRTKFYTQSAINLEGVGFLKQNLDQIVSNIIICRKNYPQEIGQAIQNARNSCFEFSIPCYVDLYSFYSELEKQLDLLKNSDAHQALAQDGAFIDLKDSIFTGMQLISKTVIANVASNHLSRAKGISIYYPQKSIDPSYFNTLFVQESLWLPFLQQATR